MQICVLLLPASLPIIQSSHCNSCSITKHQQVSLRSPCAELDLGLGCVRRGASGLLKCFPRTEVEDEAGERLILCMGRAALLCVLISEALLCVRSSSPL